jgi:hypothetical protein
VEAAQKQSEVEIRGNKSGTKAEPARKKPPRKAA